MEQMEQCFESISYEFFLFHSVPPCSIVFQCSNVPSPKNDFLNPFQYFFMQKINIALVVALLCAAFGIVLYFLQWKFWGGFLTGFCCSLALFGTVGKWQARKAAERIDRIVNASNQRL